MKKVFKILFLSLALLILVLAGTLYYYSVKHHDRIHKRVVEYLNSEFGSQVKFRDFSFSYLRSFPRIHIELLDLVIYDGENELARAGGVDMFVNMKSIWKKQVMIERLLVTDVILNQVTDSTRLKSKLPAAKAAAGDTTQPSFIFESRRIEIRNASLCFNNTIKKNRTYITIDHSHLKLHTSDSSYIITGFLDGTLDSLISNDKPLFVKQPVRGEDIKLAINRTTGVKELEEGILQIHSLSLTPRIRMEPFEDGNLVMLDISGEDDFNEFLGVFEFHLGMDINQDNPDARLNISYKQSGFVNPSIRPYSELDFEISNAIFSGADLPFPVELITVKGNYNNGESHSHETVELVIDTLYAEVSESFVGGHFKLSNLEDPYIDAFIDSKVDLGHLPIVSDNLKLSGKVELQVRVSGKISELRSLHMEGREHASGEISIHNLEVNLNDGGYILQLHKGSTVLNNHIIEVAGVVGAFNKSAFNFKGHFENLDRFLMIENERLSGRFALNVDEIDLTKIVFGGVKGGKKNKSYSSPLPMVEMDVLLKGKKVITEYGVLENFVADCRFEENLITVNSLSMNYENGKVEAAGGIRLNKASSQITLDRFRADLFDGTTTAHGKVTMDSTGINSVQLVAGFDFNHLEPGKILDEFKVLSGTDKKQGNASFPKDIDISIDFHADKLTYKDLVLENTSFKVHGDEQRVDISRFSTNPSFGSLSLEFSILDYQTDKIRYSGEIDLDIESLSVDELLDYEIVQSLLTGDKKEEGEKPGLPENLDLILDVTADKITYSNAMVSDLSMRAEYGSKAMILENLDLSFAGGMLHLNGNLTRDRHNSYPGYLYLKTDNLDMKNILKSFDDFKQEAFTWQNTSGKISTSSHHYFKLDRDLTFIRDENLWLGNVVIHHAEFDKVEPIEKTLFFVGHKAKDTMIVSELNVNILLVQDMLYFRDLLMNDNIANLAISGEVHVDAYEMDLWAEISLSDLFFRSKSKRVAETKAGIITLDKDAKLFLRLYGPLEDHKLSLVKKKKYEEHLNDLKTEISVAQRNYKESVYLQNQNQ